MRAGPLRLEPQMLVDHLLDLPFLSAEAPGEMMLYHWSKLEHFRRGVLDVGVCRVAT
jgi:hypothetical protein